MTSREQPATEVKASAWSPRSIESPNTRISKNVLAKTFELEDASALFSPSSLPPQLRKHSPEHRELFLQAASEVPTTAALEVLLRIYQQYSSLPGFQAKRLFAESLTSRFPFAVDIVSSLLVRNDLELEAYIPLYALHVLCIAESEGLADSLHENETVHIVVRMLQQYQRALTTEINAAKREQQQQQAQDATLTEAPSRTQTPTLAATGRFLYLCCSAAVSLLQTLAHLPSSSTSSSRFTSSSSTSSSSTSSRPLLALHAGQLWRCLVTCRSSTQRLQLVDILLAVTVNSREACARVAKILDSGLQYSPLQTSAPKESAQVRTLLQQCFAILSVTKAPTNHTHKNQPGD